MTYWDAFIKSELLFFLSEYCFLYGESYVEKNKKRLADEFVNKFRKMSDKEIEQKFDKFVKFINEGKANEHSEN